jgi:hypothetical protein
MISSAPQQRGSGPKIALLQVAAGVDGGGRNGVKSADARPARADIPGPGRNLHWLTTLTARIERKRAFARLANHSGDRSLSDESERQGLANHEAGHAVVAAFTRFWPLWLLIFLGLAGLALIVETSTIFTTCLAEGPGLFVKPLVQLESRRQCLGTFVDKNNGAITALAGVVVAIFTLTLWWSTRTQFKHVREVERAYLWGGGPLLKPRGPLLNPKELVEGPESRSLILTVNNYGKTPELLTKFAVGFCSRTNIPTTPQYSVVENYHDWIRPDPQGTWQIRTIDFTQRDPLRFYATRSADLRTLLV